MDTDQIHESPVQTKLTMSRLKEHERVTTSFAYLNMQGQADLNLADEMQTKLSLQNLSGRAAEFLSQSRTSRQLNERYSCSGDGRASSRASLMSGSAKIRRAKAELEKRQCLERQDIERKQQDLEQQMELLHIKYEMNTKQAELRHRKELLRIENEIEQAKLEEEAEKSSVNHGKLKLTLHDADVNREFGLSGTQYTDKEILLKDPELKMAASSRNEHAMRYPGFPSLKSKETGLSEAGCQYTREPAPAEETQPCNANPTNKPVKFVTSGTDQINRGEYNQQESLVLIAETLGSAIRKGFDMPKRDCLKFDGNPMNYSRFIENFKINIEEREQSQRVRLAYLIQFCIGTAKEAISNCVMLPEQEGYAKARKILHNSFGQSHIITSAYINKVTKGGVIRDGESEKLLQLAMDMENCQINLTQLGFESEINAQSNLEKIVSRLPRYLQANWAKEAFAILEKGKVPTFLNLTSFIIAKAKLAGSAFGQLIGSKPQEDKQPQKFRTRKPPGSSYVTQGELNILSCYFCKKVGHLLEKCYSFRSQNFESRKEFVLKEKLCNICFGKGHFAKQCRTRDHCMVAECGQRHHSLLHPVHSSTGKGIKDEPERKVNEISVDETSNGQCGVTGAGNPGVRLRVLPVKVRAMGGTEEIETYALLDDGSDVSLCDSNLVKQLGITGVPTSFSLTTVNGRTKQTDGEELRLLVSDLNGKEEIDITRAWTVNKLPISNRSIPTNDVAQWNHLNGLEFSELKNERVGIILRISSNCKTRQNICLSFSRKTCTTPPMSMHVFLTCCQF